MPTKPLLATVLAVAAPVVSAAPVARMEKSAGVGFGTALAGNGKVAPLAVPVRSERVEDAAGPIRRSAISPSAPFVEKGFSIHGASP